MRRSTPFRSNTARSSARMQLVYGDNPFAGVTIAPDDLRRACETQAKSHLVHLREGFIESGGRPTGVAELVATSAPAFAAAAAERRPARIGVTTHDRMEATRLAHAPSAYPSELVARHAGPRTSSRHRSRVRSGTAVSRIPGRSRTAGTRCRRMARIAMHAIWAAAPTRGSCDAASRRVLCVLAVTPAQAQPLPPELTQPVNDFAHVIDRAERERSWTR